MIILDEQLQGRGIESAIARWYPGAVQFVSDLRPGTIKDDAVPALLNQEPEPTFVTINESDFWQRVALTDRFCVVCLSLPDSRADEVPALLRQVLNNALFHTKAQRMGSVVRVTANEASFYTLTDKTVRIVENW